MAEQLLRIWGVIGDQERGVEAKVPVSRATWWAWVKAGKAPQPVRLGRVTAWKLSDIEAFIAGGV